MAKSGIGRRRTAALRDGGKGYAQRRRDIIAAGASVFRQRGYEAASLRDVAEVMGTDRASLYYYVASKNELFQLVTRSAIEEVVSAAEAVRNEQSNAVTRLRKLIVTTLKKYGEHYPYMFVYIQEDMARIDTASQEEVWARTMVELTHRYEVALLGIIDDGVTEGAFVTGHRHIAMYYVMGAINWTHRWYRPGGQLSAEQLGVEMADLIVGGLLGAHRENA
jgi:TetR/AcrR family transcriptional regulator, cholesterol catabolism regulator